MTGLLAWLATSRIGRWAVAIGAAALAIWVVLARAKSQGRAEERARQDAESLNNLRSRQESDNEIAGLDDAARRERLGEWVRD